MQSCSLEQITVSPEYSRKYFLCLIIVHRGQARLVYRHCAVRARIHGPQALQDVEVKKKKILCS
jgi:hypothetical protein